MKLRLCQATGMIAFHRHSIFRARGTVTGYSERLPRRIVFGTAILVIALSRLASAQGDPVLDAKGFQQNRGYVSDFEFEHIDPFSGSLLLTFTEVSLPGNAGMDLRFERVHNSKSYGLRSSWTFGIAGVPMFISQAQVMDFRGVPIALQPPPEQGLPVFYTSDGARHGTFWDGPVTDEFLAPAPVISKDFWRYDRATHVLSLPNGWIARYDVLDTVADFSENPRTFGTRYVTGIQDRFGNALEFDYGTSSPPKLSSITQQLQNGQSRVLSLEYEAGLMRRLRFGSRVWSYTWQAQGQIQLLTAVTPPVGPSWQYVYNGDGDLVSVTTPNGGVIHYAFVNHQFPHPFTTAFINSRVVHQRTIDGVVPGTWTYSYDSQIEVGTQSTTIDGPHQSTTYRYSSNYLDPSAGQPLDVSLADAGGVLQTEHLDWEQGSGVGASPFGDEDIVLHRLVGRTIQRDGRTYSTTNQYHADHFGDFNRPYKTIETGDAGTRTTTHEFDYGFAFYSSGKVGIETVQVDADSFTRAWGYDHATGFLQQEIDHGIPTTFAPDAYGNVRSVTKGNGKTTTSSYEWGAAKDVQTPEYVVSRTIGPEGLVASETRAGRTTSFAYDDLFRITTTQPPGNTAPIVTSYDNTGGGWIRVARGSSFTLTNVDGFGRAIGTTNSAGIQTRTSYDADGRKTYEGYPFGAGLPNIGVTIFYDGLGRATQRSNPDGTYTQSTFGEGTVAVRDENGRVTTQTRQAFGNPDETRLAAVTDTAGQTWQYGYNASGRLAAVTAPPGPNGEPIQRTWHYNAQNLPDVETHPESGTTSYDYDAAGVLAHKTDANGVVFSYQYDGNDRVRSIAGGGQTTTATYEPGSDNRQIATVGGVVTEFGYDAAGRLHARTDIVDGHGYARLFDYDDNDNLTRITYPSGRRVTYDYDGANRISRVRDETGARDVATNFAYHPSGAVAAYISGNGILNEMTFHDQRYWPTRVTAGALDLTYRDYDSVGNVRAIDDSRSGMNQTFVYDELDRLTSASSGASFYGGMSYGYDAHGNRTGGGQEYWSGTLRLKAQNSPTFQYDNNGNLTSAGTATYTYTADNMMETSVGPGGSAAYRYDADGWRAKKDSGGSVFFFLRGANGELLTELKDPGTSTATTRDYIYAGGRLLAVVTVP
jgi:YD repeat-containing protein